MKKKQDLKKDKVIENHGTAAWSNIDELKDVSRVPMPNEVQVINAKEWVDSNQK